MVNEIPAPYRTLVEGFTPDGLKAKGMVLESRETLRIQGAEAILIRAVQGANGTTYLKQMLIFGDTLHTVLVNGIYPDTSKHLEADIRSALLSTINDPAQNEAPLDAASFSVSTQGTDFKVVRFLSGSLSYSADGKIPTDKPTLIVGTSIAKVTAGDLKSYAEERAKKLRANTAITIRETNAVTIDHMNGYEIVADDPSVAGGAGLIYQAMLFNGEGDYYIILGQTKEDPDKNLAAYRTIAKTFRRK